MRQFWKGGSRQVNMLRVDRLTSRQVKDVIRTINTYSHRIVTFGNESLLTRQWEDLQADVSPNGRLKSLKDASMEIGAEVFKTETLSDWTVNVLREDQRQYAALDAVVLHYLNIGSGVECSQSTFKKYTFDFVNITLDPR